MTHPARLFVVFVLLLLALAVSGCGSSSSGSSATLPPEGVVGFRVNSLELQHPHFILDDQSVICEDITFDDYEFLNIDGLNSQIESRVDSRELNLVQLLDPFGMSEGDEGDAIVFDSECTDETSCEPAVNGELATATFTVSESEACLADVTGIYEGMWPDNRASDLNIADTGELACYVSDTTSIDLPLEIEGEQLTLSLQDARIGARFDDDGATAVEDGLIIGFLSEQDADEVELDLGGESYNLGEDLLPSDGAGVADCDPSTHCGGPDARVSRNGQCGWWFAFNFTGQRLDDVSGYED